MKLVSGRLLALRALNATRRLHLPTYVATRFLLDSVAGKDESSWAARILPRKYCMREKPRFLRVPKFKKIGEKGREEYREFLVPSPTTSLTEALVLHSLASCDSFMKSAAVYSYMWPRHASCPYSYEHYMNGYRERNQSIASFLRDNPDRTLIVSDIEKFYPSIEQKTIKKRFISALSNTTIAADIKETALKLVEHLCLHFPGGRGIATGPEMSHLLGDFALSEIDRELSQRFPDAYFRYVDDIVLAVKTSEKSETAKLLEDLVEKEGLKINRSKTDNVARNEWLEYGPHLYHKVNDKSFEALVFEIKIYLLLYPSKYETLINQFSDQGFSIPLSLLRTRSQQKYFLQRAMYLRKKKWKVMMKAISLSAADLIAKAIYVRDDIYRQLKQMLATPIPRGSTRRRWYIQRLRYFTNRAFYLYPHDELSFLIEPLGKMSEFVDTVALLKLLIKNDSRDIIKMPGSALATGARLLRQQGRSLPSIEMPSNDNKALVQSVAVLLLFSVGKLGTSSYKVLDKDDAKFISFCEGKGSVTGERYEFNYLDEILTLQTSRGMKDNLEMLETRFSDDESPVLDALDIGGEYIY